MLTTSSKPPHILNYLEDSRKPDFTKLRSDWLLETLVVNPSKLHFGQEVFHGDVQRLGYDLSNMNTPTPNMKEDIEF
jgi:hypothetical protein